MALFLALPVRALESVDVLSDENAALYAQIFMLQDKEKIESAKKIESKLTDKSLMNEVLYQRYTSKTYHTRGNELKAWMEKYNDMPGAERLYKMAGIKKATVRKPNVPHIMTGKEYIETAQSENWTVKQYKGKTTKTIDKFKKAIRTR